MGSHTNHRDVSRLEGASELDMVGIIETTALNFRIATERFRDCVLGVFGLLHDSNAHDALATTREIVQRVRNMVRDRKK